MPRQGNRPRVEVHRPRIEPRVAMIASNLVGTYGYPKMDARELAREVVKNLDAYLVIMERSMRRLADSASPTQTSFWRDNG